MASMAFVADRIPADVQRPSTIAMVTVATIATIIMTTIRGCRGVTVDDTTGFVMYIYLYIYIYTHIDIHIYIYIYIHMYLHRLRDERGPVLRRSQGRAVSSLVLVLGLV